MVNRASLRTRILQGIAGSLVGGLVFGVLMMVMGMLPMVAALVGASSVVVGWLVHLAISAIFGVVLGVLLWWAPWHPLPVSLLWSVAAWVGGAQVIMPVWLGQPGTIFALDQPAPWFSLVGHLMYGAAAGVVVLGLQRRAHARPVATESPA